MVAACLMVAGLGYLFFGDTGVAQSWRLPRVIRHQDVIAKRLAGEPKYQHLKVLVHTTNGGGGLVISGALPSDADLQGLKEIVESTHPPAHVDYRVVLPPK